MTEQELDRGVHWMGMGVRNTEPSYAEFFEMLMRAGIGEARRRRSSGTRPGSGLT